MVAKEVVLSDLNEDLIVTLRAIRSNPKDVRAEIEGKPEKYQNTPEAYRKIRTWEPVAPVERAARFIYLNRTAFNGLYRVNRRGEFNVPFGNYKKFAPPWELFEQMSEKLQGCGIQHGTWRRVLGTLSPPSSGESGLIYLDPPYDPLTLTSNFSAYQAEGFGPQDQEDLAAQATRLALECGFYVVASNHDTPRVRRLWEKDFDIYPIKVTRSISAKGSSRGSVPEVILVSKNMATTLTNVEASS